MEIRNAANVFPLPLTTFEHYMLLDDRPDYPMTYVVRLFFSGVVQREPFASALSETLQCHPLFCALTTRGKHGRPCWVLSAASEPTVTWNATEASIDAGLNQPLNLTSQCGLRIWISEDANSSQATFQIHHACCDGIGAVRFLSQLLATYGLHATPNTGPAPQRVGMPSELLKRDCRAVLQGRGNRVGECWSNIVDAAFWCTRQATVLQGSNTAEPSSSEPLPCLGMQQHVFAQSETTALAETARRHGVTVNDLLVRDLLQVLRQWIEGQLSLIHI